MFTKRSDFWRVVLDIWNKLSVEKIKTVIISFGEQLELFFQNAGIVIEYILFLIFCYKVCK